MARREVIQQLLIPGPRRRIVPAMRAMIIKEFREVFRDHRTVGMLVMLPLLLLVVFGYAANFTVTSVATAVVGPQAEQVAAQLTDQGDFFEVSVIDTGADRAAAEQMVVDNEVDVAIVTGGGTPQALVDGSSLFAAQAAVSVLNRAGDTISTTIMFNPELKTSWVMIPAIIGLILTFIGTIVTSIGMVRERESGTLEQLAVMPIKPSSVILGKIAPYFLLASIDMLIVTVLGVLIFDVPFNGNPAEFALGAGLFLFVVLGLGIFISTISQNAGQAIQTAFFFLLPQILLSGMIFPLVAIPWGVRWISYLLPLTYFTMISQGVMIRGAGIDTLLLPFAALTVMAAVIFTGAVLRFRRDLAPAPRAPLAVGADEAVPA
jgi:ABC-2 type transport system permease protein